MLCATCPRTKQFTSPSAFCDWWLNLSDGLVVLEADWNVAVLVLQPVSCWRVTVTAESVVPRCCKKREKQPSTSDWSRAVGKRNLTNGIFIWNGCLLLGELNVLTQDNFMCIFLYSWGQFFIANGMWGSTSWSITTLGHQGRRRVFWEGPKSFKLCPTRFSGMGEAPLLPRKLRAWVPRLLLVAFYWISNDNNFHRCRRTSWDIPCSLSSSFSPMSSGNGFNKSRTRFEFPFAAKLALKLVRHRRKCATHRRSVSSCLAGDDESGSRRTASWRKLDERQRMLPKLDRARQFNWPNKPRSGSACEAIRREVWRCKVSQIIWSGSTHGLSFFKLVLSTHWAVRARAKLWRFVFQHLILRFVCCSVVPAEFLNNCYARKNEFYPNHFPTTKNMRISSSLQLTLMSVSLPQW